jgi:hypothetical protein
MLKTEVAQLLHLISISLAIGLAYIALDRFRCAKRVKILLQGAIDHIITLDKDAAIEDTTITLLRQKLKDISQNGLGVKFIFKKCSRMFGSGDNAGWDVIVINLFIGLEYICLVIGSLFPTETNLWIYWGIVCLCVIGTLLPVVFISSSMKAVNNVETFIEVVFKGLTEKKGYDFSISQLKDKLNNHG